MDEPLNGIPATWTHDEGAYAQCGDCGRYSADSDTLRRHSFGCECGSLTGWSGSFKKPGPDAKWSGSAPGVALGDAPSLPQREFDALMDHIYEYGTAAEGVRERALKLCEVYARGVAPSDGWREAGLVCQACAGDAPGGKCRNPKCIGGPIVRELVPDGKTSDGVSRPAGETFSRQTLMGESKPK